MVILAAHDSLTANKALHWYMKPFTFLAKCQSKSVADLYKSNVRLFDIRVRVTDKNEVIACHGAYEYKADVISILQYLNSKSTKDDKIYVRIINEDTFLSSNHSNFLFWAKYKVANKFTNLTYMIIDSKKNWTTVYNDFPGVPDRCMFWTKDKDCYYPKQYADKHNIENILS